MLDISTRNFIIGFLTIHENLTMDNLKNNAFSKK